MHLQSEASVQPFLACLATERSSLHLDLLLTYVYALESTGTPAIREVEGRKHLQASGRFKRAVSDCELRASGKTS